MSLSTSTKYHEIEDTGTDLLNDAPYQRVWLAQLQCPQVLKTLLVGRQYGLQVACNFELSCLRGIDR